jgi:hypothetical protein
MNQNQSKDQNQDQGSSQWKTEEEETIQAQLSKIISTNELSAIDKFRKEYPAAPVTEAVKEGVKEGAYIPRTYLALVPIDEENYGIVEDTLADIMWVPGKGELVGTWTRPGYDNMIHISLLTHIQALQDRSTITWRKYAEERKAMKATSKKPKKAKVAKEDKENAGQLEEETPAELSVEVQLGFNKLRAKLMKTKVK